jgi:hypothetical protein
VAHIPAGSTDFPVFRNMGNAFEDRQNRARVYSGRLVWRLNGGMGYLYQVFTKEWCGFKNVLNDCILQLDGALSPHFHRNVRELLNRVLQQRWIGRAANGDNHIRILYGTNSIIV